MNDTIIEAYIKPFDELLQERYLKLVKIVSIHTNETPRMSYGMPTWGKNPNILHLAIFKGHIGVYPGPEKIDSYHSLLQGIKYSKGAIQFSHDQALPIEIFETIVKSIFK